MNLTRRDTDKLADVSIGDLIKIHIKEKELIGIVLTYDDNSMELQTPDGQVRWMSRYVIYEKIQ
mgnify:CR=1 FL=1